MHLQEMIQKVNKTKEKTNKQKISRYNKVLQNPEKKKKKQTLLTPKEKKKFYK